MCNTYTEINQEAIIERNKPYYRDYMKAKIQYNHAYYEHKCIMKENKNTERAFERCKQCEWLKRMSKPVLSK